MRLARAIHRGILRLAPRTFRAEFAREADRLFAEALEDRLRHRGRLAAATFAVTASLDAVRTAVREHLRGAEAPSFAGLGLDLRSAVRLILQRPSYGVSVIVTVALSAGVLAAVFAFVDPLLWRPLPLPGAARVVVARAEGADVVLNNLQVADYLRLVEPTASFETVGSYYGAGVGEVEGVPNLLHLMAVTPGFLHALGVEPVVGRAFRADEYRDPAPAVVLITHDVWNATFGGRADVVGSTLVLRGFAGRRAYEVIGVLPRGFLMPNDSRATVAGLVPGEIRGADISDRRAWTPVVARLRVGISRDAAEQELRAISVQTERAYPTLPQNRRVSLRPLREVWFGDVGGLAMLLFAGAAAVLLVAAVNLTHLVKARLRARGPELAIRMAVGASRARLVRLLTAELAVLMGAGALLAVLVGRLGLLALAAAVPYYETSYQRIPSTFDDRAIGVLVLAVAGMAVAIHARAVVRWTRAGTLKMHASRSAAGRRSEIAFVFTQSALAMGLVVCSLQVTASLLRMGDRGATLAEDGLQLVSVNWSGRRDYGSVATHDLQRRSAEAMRARFGAQVAAFTSVPGGSVSIGAVRREGSEAAAGRPVEAVSATPDAFALIGLQLLSGRLYTEAEVWADAPVAVADRRAAALLWPGENPVGKAVIDDTDEDHPIRREIVGLVESLRVVRQPGAFEKGMVFTPFSRTTQPTFNFLYRADDGVPRTIEIRRTLAAVDPDVLVAIAPFMPNERQVGQVRFVSVTLVALTALTLLLASIGLFGMVSHAAAQRTREIAIRISLGALPAAIKRSLVGHHLLAVSLGLGLGAAIALRAAIALEPVRFDVRPDAGASYLGGALLMLSIATAASYLPVRRASRLDPAVTLRTE